MKLKRITSAWHDYPYAEGVRFSVKAMNSGLASQIRDEGMSDRVVMSVEEGAKPEIIQEVRRKAENEAYICLMVEDWEGLYDADDKVLKCTSQNRLRLCRELDDMDYQKLVKWLRETVHGITQVAEIQQEESEKNSETTRDGLPQPTE